MVIKKTKELGDKLSVTYFLYSRGWLRGLKKRHGIRLHEARGEAESISTTVIQSGRQQLQQNLAGHAPRETGLFYRLDPNATLATAPVAGKRKSKDRLTSALCSYAKLEHGDCDIHDPEDDLPFA